MRAGIDPDRPGLAERLEAAESLALAGTYELLGEAFVLCSPRFLAIHGYAADGSPPELDDFLDRIQAEDREALSAAIEAAREAGGSYEVRYRVVRPDGTRRIVQGRGSATRTSTGECSVLGAVHDITEKQHAVDRLVAAESRYSAIIEHAHDGIWILDRQGRTTFVNRRLTELLGVPAADLLGKEPSAFAADGLPDLQAERRSQFECVFRRADGSELHATNAVSRLPDLHGGGTVLIVTDITSRKHMEERLRDAAMRDALTGLVNRTRFTDVLDDLLEHASQRSTPVGLLFLDLDHFKYVNDSFGHAVGDALLCEVASALPPLVRGGDVIGRVSGDEFVIALPDADTAVATAVAERILGGIRSQRWQALSRLTASIGIAMADPARPTTAAELLVAADSALHDAKSNGRDQLTIYAGGAGGGFEWVDEIRAALEEDRFVLHAQAIETARGEGARRYELLVRMRGRDGGLIPPGSFIPAAEQFGLMVEIDRWVIGNGLELARGGMPVQLNLSGTSLGDPAIRELVEAGVAGGVPPDLLTFEVTETAAVRNIETAREFAGQLKRLGCAFALDDFGTGFGSLIYLRHLPVSHLKVDREFVRDLVNSPADERLVRAIVEMARPLGLETVAEGVEDDPTLELLREIGVDYVQGFGIERPFELDLDRAGSHH